jgi:hypothetical protein
MEDLPLARIPTKWNHFADKDLCQINMLEQILIARVFNLGSRPGQAFGGIAQVPRAVFADLCEDYRTRVK